MYKHIIMGAALALGMTACTEDYTDWSKPQHNNPEEAKTIAIEVAKVDAINFAELDGVDSVQLFTTSITASETPQLTYQVQLSSTGELVKKTSLMADANCKVAVADLKAAIETLYGKAPVLRTMPTEVISYATVGAQTFKYVGNTEVQATLVAPVIESAYYLVGNINGWNYEGAIATKFSHSDVNVYDDPVFTITVPAPKKEDGTRDDFYFKLVPESALAGGSLNWDGVIGTAYDSEEPRAEELLKIGGSKAFKQSAEDGAKFYTITLNMMDYKMTVTPLSFEEYIYVPGNHQSWSPETAPALHSPAFDGIYTGFVNFDGEFKFTKKRDWSSEYNYNDFTTFSDSFTSGGGSNISSTAGLFYLTVNVPTKELKATPITKVGVIGTLNGWGGDEELTYNAAEDCYEGNINFDGGKFKFRFNGGWDLNLGGSLDNLTQGGNDISVGTGSHQVKLYLSRAKNNNIYCTVTPL